MTVIYHVIYHKSENVPYAQIKRGIILNHSLSQQVYEKLLNRILYNELVPGEMINRREVAATLGVSVAPTLEAMLQLETEGFLETIPRKGTRIRVITDEDLRGQIVLRQALECQAARLYHGRLVTAHGTRLAKLAQKVDASTIGSRENWQSEIVFHRALVELADCPALLREFNKVMRLSLFFSANKSTTINFNAKYDRIIKSHLELVRNLETDDPDQAEKLLREHLTSGLLSKYDK